MRAADSISIVGCGAVTALGYSAAMTAASIRASLSRFRESYLIDKAGEPAVLSLARFIPDRARGFERFLALARIALAEAMQPLAARVSERPQIRLGLAMGLPSPRPGLAPDLAERLPAQFETVFAHMHVSETGHASGLTSIRQAVEWVRSGEADFAIAGGVDSYYDADTIEWLDEANRLKSDGNLDGFVPGEGAGFCLLASAASARAFGLQPLAAVLSTAVDQEPHPLISDGVCIGQGLTSVLKQALSVDLAEGGKSADSTLCDMNGESFRSTEWMYAYLRTGRKHRDPLELWHPADCYGDIGAASGAVLTTVAIRAWERGYSRGNRSLIWSASDGPERAALLIERAWLN